MRKFWKHTNAKWLIILLLLSGVYVSCTILCKTSILPKHATAVLNEIVLASFSAAVLLLIFEIILFRRDQKELGCLEGRYIRKYITEINEDGKRSKNIDPAIRRDEENRSNIKFLDDYKYHELKFYACDTTDWLITLNYSFAGNYTGIAEYYLHGVKSPHDFPKPKTNVEINLSLSSADKITGTGSYKYQTSQDYGIYRFQVVDKAHKKILVYYENILPSGLAEGYEIWEKK
jgi:hypothetical protein